MDGTHVISQGTFLSYLSWYGSMKEKNHTIKTPMSEEKIFKSMMTAVFLVAALFFVKNIISKAWTGAIVIGVCLVVFSVTVILMKKGSVNAKMQQLVLCLSIVFLVFCISLNRIKQ